VVWSQGLCLFVVSIFLFLFLSFNGLIVWYRGQLEYMSLYFYFYFYPLMDWLIGTVSIFLFLFLSIDGLIDWYRG